MAPTSAAPDDSVEQQIEAVLEIALERMAGGTGVVASDQVGAAYDLIGPDTGFCQPTGDVAGLARALPGLMARSAELGHAAKARIASWDFRADIAGLRSALEAVVRP